MKQAWLIPVGYPNKHSPTLYSGIGSRPSASSLRGSEIASRAKRATSRRY